MFKKLFSAVLALTLIFGLSYMATALSAAAQTIHIQGANMNIYNSIDGEGSTGEHPVDYGFEVFIDTVVELKDVFADDIVLTVGETTLPITEIEVESLSDIDIIAKGRFGMDATTEPIMGEYRVSVKKSPPCYIGKLEDIPKDAPEMVYPQHGQMITDTTPIFKWEAFQSDYLGNMVVPCAYEIGLRFSFSETISLTAYPIPGDQTSLDYSTAEWEIEPPDIEPPTEFTPGTYSLTIHSNHNVADGFSFQHHRVIEFVVITEKVEIEIEIKPETLNLNSKGVFTAFIDLPEGYNEEDIDVSTVECEGTPALKGMMADDGRLIVKFDRKKLEDVPTGDAVELTVMGKLIDDTIFIGSDTIRVISKGNAAPGKPLFTFYRKTTWGSIKAQD